MRHCMKKSPTSAKYSTQSVSVLQSTTWSQGSKLPYRLQTHVSMAEEDGAFTTDSGSIFGRTGSTNVQRKVLGNDNKLCWCTHCDQKWWSRARSKPSHFSIGRLSVCSLLDIKILLRQLFKTCLLPSQLHIRHPLMIQITRVKHITYSHIWVPLLPLLLRNPACCFFTASKHLNDGRVRFVSRNHQKHQ